MSVNNYPKLEELKAMREKALLDTPMLKRLKFTKTGSLQYISHLDLQRTFNRVLVRSVLPVWYTKGFNPHVKLVFSSPLSIGQTSICELCDIRFSRDISDEEIKTKLNANLTEEMKILEVYTPYTKFQDICCARYEIEILSESSFNITEKEILDIFTCGSCVLEKNTKSGVKNVDLVQSIKEILVSVKDTRILIQTILPLCGEEYIKPDMLITALKQRCDIFSEDLTKQCYNISRTMLLDKNNKEFR